MSAEFEFQAELEALSLLEELKKEKGALDTLRRANSKTGVAAIRREKGNLKSDLKKSTAFVKKIRAITCEGLQQCLRDAETINLSHHISEIASAIVEAKFKVSEVSSIIKLCVLLHQRYEDFTSPVLQGLKDALLSESSEDSGKTRRIQLRMLTELYQCGVFVEEEFFVLLLRYLSGKPIGVGKATHKQPIDLAGLVTFVKYGSQILLGYPLKRHLTVLRNARKSPDELPSMLLASQCTCNELRAQLVEVGERIAHDLIEAHASLRNKEKRAEKDKAVHGSLNEAKQAELEQAQKLFDKLLSTMSSLSEATELEIPLLKEEEEKVAEGNIGISLWEGAGNSAGVDTGPWGDIETKTFYEDLPDLLSMVPLSVLGLTAEQVATLREQWKEKKDITGEGDEGADNLEAPSGSEDIDLPAELLRADDSEKLPAGVTEEKSEGTANVVKISNLLQDVLPECYSKQKDDEFCVSFCYYATKKNRKHLISALHQVPKHRMEATAHYARITASLTRLYPEIGPTVLDNLKRQYYGIFMNKTTDHLEFKLRNIRYIGELVKFNIAPPIVVFKIFNQLISDFTHHNVEICAALLETCGRYLYLQPFTHDRVEAILETILRLRRAKNLDLHLQTVLEAAYFAVKPPERKERAAKQYTPAQQYARHLILSRLSTERGVVDGVIKQLRKLPWNDTAENIEWIVVKACLKLSRAKYTNIPLAADCISGLSQYRPNALVRLVDVLYEEIMRGLSAPHKREQQRMLSYAKLMGELYNFSAVSSVAVFDMLYMFLSFGYGDALVPSTSLTIHDLIIPRRGDPKLSNELDMPTDFFRIQLVSELLGTCGSYFVKGTAKERLQEFLAYFQRYLFCKPALPLHTEFAVLDLFDSLEQMARDAAKRQKDKSTIPSGPHFVKYETYDDVMEAVRAIEAKMASHTCPSAEEDEPEEEEEEDVVEENDEAHSDDGENGDDEEDADAEAEALARIVQAQRSEEEEEEFDKAFKAMMMASLESARGSASSGLSKAVDVDRMALPAGLPPPKNMPRMVSGDASSDSEDYDNDEPEQAKAKPIAFKMLSRDQRGRIETRQLMLPGENPLALKQAKAIEEARTQREKVKEKVLKLHDDADDAVVNDLSAQYGAPSARHAAPAVKDEKLHGRGGRGGGRIAGERPSNIVVVQKVSNEPHQSANTLDFDGLLRESAAADARRFQSSRGRGPVVQGRHDSGRGSRGGRRGGGGRH